MKNYSDNPKVNEYIQHSLEIQKRLKKNHQEEWFWSKGIVLLNTLLAFIAAVASIIALLK